LCHSAIYLSTKLNITYFYRLNHIRYILNRSTLEAYMTFPVGANLYTLGFGTRPENIEVPHYDVRAPTSTDVLYPIGKEWVWPGNSIWKLLQLSAANNITTATWVQISNSTGDILAINGTANQITASTTSGTTTLSIPSTFIAPGSISATLGNITATNGNLVLGTAGNKIVSTSVATTTTAGANSFGSVALVGGTATVATTAVTANSLIFLTSQALGTVTVASALDVTAKTAGTSFVITASQGTDTSTIAWMIVN